MPIVALTGVLTALVLSLTAVFACKLKATPLMTAIFLTFGTVLVFPVLTLRASILDYLFIILILTYTPAIVRFLLRNEKTLLITFTFIVFVCAVGVNLHLTWPLVALAFLLTAFACIKIVTRDWVLTLKLTLFLTSAAIIGLLCSPLNYTLFTHALTTASVSTDYISEWEPTWNYFWLLPFLFVTFYASVYFYRQKVTRYLTLPVLFLTFLSFTAVRFSPYAVTISVVFLACVCSKSKLSRLATILLTSVLVVLNSLILILFTVGNRDALEQITNPAEVSALPANCRLFASPTHSGAVILFRPDVKVFIDGRNDYWGQRYKVVSDVLKSNSGADQIVKLGGTCVLTSSKEKTDKILETSLKNSPQWTPVSVEDYTIWTLN